MTYKELLDYLLQLNYEKDARLEDTATVYNCADGEYYPAEIVEFTGDDILDDGTLFIMAKDWNE